MYERRALHREGILEAFGDIDGVGSHVWILSFGDGTFDRVCFMRRELFAHHLPNPDRVTADYAVLAGLSKGLSGGDILNVCVNAIYAGSLDADLTKWMVTQGDA